MATVTTKLQRKVSKVTKLATKLGMGIEATDDPTVLLVTYGIGDTGRLTIADDGSYVENGVVEGYYPDFTSLQAAWEEGQED